MPDIAAERRCAKKEADGQAVAPRPEARKQILKRLSAGACVFVAGLLLQPSPLSVDQADASGRAATPLNPVPPRADERPNIVLIVADDLGYRDLGAYGGKIRTPNIDALARSGIRYDTAYATAPTCSPSRAGLLSGRYQQRFGFYFNLTGRDEAVGMPGSETTIAEVARRANYRTAMVGKWHVGSAGGRHPLDQGFDSFYGFVGGATRYYPDGATNLVDADAGADALVTRARFPIMDGRSVVTPQGNLTDVFTDHAIDFIRKNRQQPFFLYLAYNAPHMPLQATEDDVKPFASLPSVFDRVYHAMMTTLDRDVGRVTNELRSLGLSRKTIVIFVSDNGCPNYVRGACSNAPFSGYKAYPLEGGNRVPFILSAPGRVRAGQVEKRPISTLDIMPTIAGALRQPTPANSEGVNLLPTVRSKNDRVLFWRMGPNYWVRKGPWKLIVINKTDSVQDLKDVIGKPMPTDGADDSPQGQWKMLFNLDRDIGEKRDVSAQYPEVVARLDGLYRQWNARNIDPAFTSRREFRTDMDGRKVQLIF